MYRRQHRSCSQTKLATVLLPSSAPAAGVTTLYSSVYRRTTPAIRTAPRKRRCNTALGMALGGRPEQRIHQSKNGIAGRQGTTTTVRRLQKRVGMKGSDMGATVFSSIFCVGWFILLGGLTKWVVAARSKWRLRSGCCSGCWQLRTSASQLLG